jgi:hypothetical protein
MAGLSRRPGPRQLCGGSLAICRLPAYHLAVPVELALESTVVLAAASLAAAALTAALQFVSEREWTAVVFLMLAASVTVWYGFIALFVVRSAFAVF